LLGRQLICDRLKPVLSECMVDCRQRLLTLIGSPYEIAFSFGIPVGGRSGAIHLGSNRCPHSRFAEVSSSSRIRVLSCEVCQRQRFRSRGIQLGQQLGLGGRLRRLRSDRSDPRFASNQGILYRAAPGSAVRKVFSVR
jgi:hypothetical protein